MACHRSTGRRAARVRAGAAAAVAALLLVPVPAARALEVQIVNASGRPAADVFVMLHGGASSDGQFGPDAPRRLSQIRRHRFAVAAISGRIFFSYGAPVVSAEPPHSSIRYDKVEITYPGVANLTAVDFFGIPFRLQTLDRRGRVRQTLAFHADTETVVRALRRIPGARRAIVTTRRGGFLRFLSPQLSQSSYPSFLPYVRSLAGQRTVLAGPFYGSPFQTFRYAGRFERDGSIRLSGTIRTGRSVVRGLPVAVDGRSLGRAIYTADGPFTVGGAPRSVSDNDVYSAIYRDLVSGFAWGYLGGRYGNDSLRWSRRPPFAAARPRRERYATYNEYAAVIRRYSDAYGFAFSDTGNQRVQAPLAGAAAIRITILPDRPR